MKAKMQHFYLLNFFLLLSLFIVTIVLFPRLSEQIPIHWSSSGSVNNTMSKGIFLGILAVTGFANLGLYILDKKQKLKKQTKTEKIITVLVLSLFTIIFAFFLWIALQ